MAHKELKQSEIKAIMKLGHESNISINETSYNSGVYGVNWPGKGTKTVAETQQFITQLRKAIALAERINRRK